MKVSKQQGNLGERFEKGGYWQKWVIKSILCLLQNVQRGYLQPDIFPGQDRCSEKTWDDMKISPSTGF